MEITNPILTGFNPDPSLCRQGEDYYMSSIDRRSNGVLTSDQFFRSREW